jgi:hypothetical protein
VRVLGVVDIPRDLDLEGCILELLHHFLLGSVLIAIVDVDEVRLMEMGDGLIERLFMDFGFFGYTETPNHSSQIYHHYTI